MADVDMNMEHSRAQLEVQCLSELTVFPAALKTIIQLDVADTLAAADSPLSAQDILNSLPQKTEAASAKNLERLLRILAFKGKLFAPPKTFLLLHWSLAHPSRDRLQDCQQLLCYVFFSNSHIEHFNP